MDEPGGAPEMLTDDRRLLEALVVDNPDLERLEALLDQFNIFEAAGLVRQELRHSHFLAFLLSPRQTHGLGTLFVTRLLQHALAGAADTAGSATSLDLALGSLDDLVVLREWQNIDLLLLDEAHRLAVIIENKIDSGEHSDQLRRYRERVAAQYSGWRVVGLYLTPEGEVPSHPAYVPISYELIHALVEDVLATQSANLTPDVCMALAHYAQLLRRHIMSDSDIAELCRRIYQRHQRALDLIYEHRPDLQGELRDFLEELVRADDRLVLDRGNKQYVRFAPKAWEVEALKQGKGWTASGRMLLFEFDNAPNQLVLKLTIGPGPKAMRQWLFDQALQHKGHPFNPPYGALWSKWSQIFTLMVLQARDYDSAGPDELKEKIRTSWEGFRARELDQILATLQVEPPPALTPPAG